ncbi:hypothetical protein ABCR94_00045 [Streptomyces sp. 21So2-11]|uniref:hypothetical protein n=1 Tax=Streptomyces sp. 21So2-11 TaxID=3144408 RepID=UPI00321A0D24
MSMDQSRSRGKLGIGVGAVCAVALPAGTWWMISAGASADESDRSLTYAESTTVPLQGSRVEVSYLSVDSASSNIPNYGDSTFTPHIALTAYNDSDEAQDYTVTFKVLRAGKGVEPYNTTVKIRQVEPDAKGLGQYEISEKEWDPDLYDDEPGQAGAESETYIDSPTGKDFTLKIVSVKAEKHYAISGH